MNVEGFRSLDFGIHNIGELDKNMGRHMGGTLALKEQRSRTLTGMHLKVEFTLLKKIISYLRCDDRSPIIDRGGTQPHHHHNICLAWEAEYHNSIF